MSPEQLKSLRELSRHFADGSATPENIRQLSELLASINHRDEIDEIANSASDYNPIESIKL